MSSVTQFIKERKIFILSSNWRKLLSKSLEDTYLLEKIEPHSHLLDLLDDYRGRIFIDGESYSVDTLRLLYLTAVDNVCSPAVLDFLASLEDSDSRDGLVNEVFIELAIEQRRKSRFESELRKELKKRKSRIELEPAQPLSQYVVEDLLSELSLSVSLNLVTKKLEVAGLGSKTLFELHSRSNILAVLPSLLLDRLREKGVTRLGQGTKLIEQYLFNIADINRYNPIHDMLSARENDDQGNLDLLYCLLGLEDEFDQKLVLKWMIQTVALSFNSLESPISSEGVLVLQGPQGCGKTSFFRRFSMKPEWFTEGAVIDVKNKDSLISAVSTWICELGEIDSTLAREQSALKSFITRPIDRIRFPYAAAESELVRCTSLCGTVNPEQFLNDPTGARRYWVVKVDKIDKDFLFSMTEDQIGDIWGYVYHLYKAQPDSFRLSDDDRAKLEGRNRRHNCELKFESEVLELLDFSIGREYWTEVNSAKIAGFIPGASAVHIGRVLTKLSDDGVIEKVNKSLYHGSRRYYIPIKQMLLSNTAK